MFRLFLIIAVLYYCVYLRHWSGFQLSAKPKLKVLLWPITKKKVKPWSHYWLIAAGAYPGFCSMKRLGVFLLPLDGMLVHRRSLPRNLLGFPNNSPVSIYTPGWREALWELSVLPKNTTQCPPARARTRTARSEDERTNHEATAPLLNNHC